MDGLYSQIRIALHQVWRRRWLAAAVAWGVAVLGWLVIALIPNSYEAKARLFVQQQQVLANLPGSTVEDRNAQMLRLKQTLVSNENLTRVDRQSGRQREYDLRIADLIRRGDMRANVRLEPGDVIIIPESMF